MRRDLRLRQRRDFDAVFRLAPSWNGRLLVLRALPNNLAHNRFGFITSKRLGKAVVRNKARRRIRESARVLPLEQGWDIVFAAKAAAGGATFKEINQSVSDLLAKAGLLRQEDARPEKADA